MAATLLYFSLLWLKIHHPSGWERRAFGSVRFMYIVIDTETTGLPTSWQAPPSDVDNWPRVVQLAWETFDVRARETGKKSYLIRPEGFTIPKDLEKVHGISTAIAKRRGIPIGEVLDSFRTALGTASVIVAHNFKFDSSVLAAEFHRLGIKDKFGRKTHVCTMEAATDFCAIPGRYGYKWPTLAELHMKLFGKSATESHDAAADVRICAKCFFELTRLRVIRVSSGARR